MLYLTTAFAEQEAAAEIGDGVMASNLQLVQQSLFWQQTTRWIKYEQCIEGGGTRFSRPYITLLSIAAILQVKNCLRRGLVLLDSSANTFVRVCDQLIEQWVIHGQLGSDEALQNLVKEILFAPKLHLVGGKMRRVYDGDGRLRRASFNDSIHSGHLSNSSYSSNSCAEEAGRIRSADERLLKKLAPNTESAAILIANVNALERPLSAFIRLKYPTMLYPEVPDHPVPVRFLFVLLNSMDNYPGETFRIGRAIGALLSDEVFQKVALHCEERNTLVDAVDEFLSQIVVIPPAKCSTEARWTRDEGADESAVRHVGMLYANFSHDDRLCSQAFYSEEFDSNKRISMAGQHSGLEAGQPTRTGQLFGGLVQDIRQKLPWFPSDFLDFFRGRLSQSLACTLVLFLANLSNIITFGAVMERSLHHQMASIENIICGALSGIVFGMFSGQPLNILSATGPTLIFERILYDFCTAKHWEFLPFRLYVGVWMTFYLLLLVATDASALWNSTLFKNLSVGVSRCVELGGEPQGLQCYFKPDVRNLISDFSVLIAIVSLTLTTYLIGLEVPSLKMPASIRPTMDRTWLVDATNIEDYTVALIAAFPALFYTILLVMDQQITAVIVNRRDNKLRKGCGYHLDLLIVAFLVLICSFLGLPFYVAATVLSVMHVESLKQYVDCIVPGESQKFLGVKEQRLTAVFAHALIGCSVFLTPLVKNVPVPVLTGIFFYMGVVSLLGQQFVQRLALLFMPVKYQPDYIWLRSVPIKRVHTFTCIQLLSIGSLLAMKYSSSMLSMMFPMMLILTVLLRMFLLQRLFTRRELKSLDDELPSFRDVIRPMKIFRPTEYQKKQTKIKGAAEDEVLAKRREGNEEECLEKKTIPQKDEEV
uniref:Anion exchange protein n=2 Tax=Meloidogyne incognita group TaxID=654580 RepID=A0A915M2B9_MELJA